MRLGVATAVLALLAAACGAGDDGSGPGAALESPAGSPSSSVTTMAPATTSADVDATEVATTVSEEVQVTTTSDHDQCAHVVDATITERGDGVFSVSATVRSNETGWDKYADRWEVRAPDGAVLGERVLLHPHETEQPFTRSLNDVAIPAELTEVLIAAHDSVVGFCGDQFRVAVPGR